MTRKHSIVCFALMLFGNEAGIAASVDVTSGTSGSLTPVGQSYNETRAVDVTELSDLDFCITSMTLRGLGIGSATSAVVGARIYNTSDTSLVAQNSVTIFSGGTVTVPISATLVSGGIYRIGFYVETSPQSRGYGFFFDPDPPGLGGFPYTEATGLLRINNAYSIASDTFPANWNIYVPQMTFEGILNTHLRISVAYPKVLVQWPAAVSNATLEVTSTPTIPNDWVAVTNLPTITGSNVVVTLPISSKSQFYRLNLPNQ
jgi:hypothetical protein